MPDSTDTRVGRVVKCLIATAPGVSSEHPMPGGELGATMPAASELHCRITSTEIEALLATNAINEFAKTLSSASPSVSKEEMNHYLRVMQRGIG